MRPVLLGSLLLVLESGALTRVPAPASGNPSRWVIMPAAVGPAASGTAPRRVLGTYV